MGVGLLKNPQPDRAETRGAALQPQQGAEPATDNVKARQDYNISGIPQTISGEKTNIDLTGPVPLKGFPYDPAFCQVSTGFISMFSLPPFKSTTHHTMCDFNVALTPRYITEETEVPARMLSIPTPSEFDQNSLCPDRKFPAARNLATASFFL